MKIKYKTRPKKRLEDFKIGDTIIVLEQMDCWSSKGGPNCPLEKSITLPYKGIVTKELCFGTEYYCIGINDYGFAVDLKKKGNEGKFEYS